MPEPERPTPPSQPGSRRVPSRGVGDDTPSRAPRSAPRPGGGAGRPQARRVPPRPQAKPTPAWLKVSLIVAPLVLIGLVVRLTRNKTSDESAQVVVSDPNQRIKELEKECETIQRKDYPAWRQLLQKEDSTAPDRQEALLKKIDRWCEEWDTLFDARRDADGNLPADLQGYSRVRANMNMLRSDVIKSSGF